MNLTDHFEPLAPDADGLQRVRRTARHRAITRKLSSGTAVLMLVVLATGTLTVADNWFYSPGLEIGSTDALTDQKSNTGIASPATSGNAQDSSLLADWMIYSFALGLLILLVTFIASLVQERHTDTPLLRFSFGARIGLAVGLLLVAVPASMAIISRLS